MSNLASIKTLYRNANLELIGIPYRMGPGQSPRELERAHDGYVAPKPGWYGPKQIDLSDWICLGWPGWWGSIPRERQAEIQQFLELHDVPQNPFEFVEI